MATVTGKTSEKLDELFDATVVTGAMDADGNLTLETRGGTNISAGSVAGSVVDAHIDGTTHHLILETRDGNTIDVGYVATSAPTSFDNIWPVGSIFMSVVATNPNTLLGGGTWTRWGKGRMPVSLDETDTQFDGVEETGGEKTHTLTTAEMPSHAHGGGTTNAGTHTHQTVSTNGVGFQTSQHAKGDGSSAVSTRNLTQADGDHVHGIYAEGGGQPHNNLPPYITCYMWKRTS